MEFVQVKPFTCDQEFTNDILELSYELDHFQKWSAIAIENDENVLVTAHTASGKSTVAEYAIAKAFALDKKVIYASPIKVLSNQKYSDFRKKFGDDIGIMTGDIKLNPDAQCMVMTTEILREMLFKDSEYIKDIKYVIFDEVHYINDRSRGHVWEQTLVMLPREITLILLSATIDKPQKFCSWLGTLKQKKINLIRTKERPIPLNHYIYWNSKIHHTMDNNSNIDMKNANHCIKSFTQYPKKNKKRYNFRKELNPFIQFLKNKNLLPTLFFVFSKRRCEQYAHSVITPLVTPEEAAEINKIFDFHFLGEYKKYKYLQQVVSIKELLLKGVAIHHSGLVPILKEVVEILFDKGLLKVLFATETFAVGVNMPTKTVVFTELKKFDGYIKAMRYLNTGEYLQMAGRAGRRGIDTTGTVIYFPTKETPSAIMYRSILKGKYMEIKSKLKINSQTILKVINSSSQDLIDFIGKSLFGKENKGKVGAILEHIVSMEQELIKLDKIIDYYDESLVKDVEKYNSINSKLKKLKNKKKKALLKKLHHIKITEEFMRVKDYISQRTKLQAELDKEKGYSDVMAFTNEIRYCLEYLNYMAYVNIPDYETIDLRIIDKSHLELKGIIASEINHCNELLLTEVIINNTFKDMEIKEIIGGLAALVDDKFFSEKLLSDMDIPENSKQIVKEIETWKNTLIDTAIEFNVAIECNINMQFMESAYKWACGGEYKDIYPLLDIYEGNFIKGMIKICNITQEIAKICNIVKEFELEEKFLEAEELIMRDIVNFDSIHLS